MACGLRGKHGYCGAGWHWQPWLAAIREFSQSAIHRQSWIVPLYALPLCVLQGTYGLPAPYGNLSMAPQYGYMGGSPTAAGIEAVGGAMYGAYPPPGMLMPPHMMQARAGSVAHPPSVRF